MDTIEPSLSCASVHHELQVVYVWVQGRGWTIHTASGEALHRRQYEAVHIGSLHIKNGNAAPSYWTVFCVLTCLTIVKPLFFFFSPLFHCFVSTDATASSHTLSSSFDYCCIAWNESLIKTRITTSYGYAFTHQSTCRLHLRLLRFMYTHKPQH